MECLTSGNPQPDWEDDDRRMIQQDHGFYLLEDREIKAIRAVIAACVLGSGAMGPFLTPLIRPVHRSSETSPIE